MARETVEKAASRSAAPDAAHKTSALPLTLVYAALIVYASLYPLSGWRDQGIVPWSFVMAPLPRYWTWFDFIINIIGYAPLGFIGALTVLRPRTRWGAWGVWGAVLYATLGSVALSFCLESTQSYLPMRVSSNVDWALNSAGALTGAVLAAALERLGWVAHWSRVRAVWLVPQARGALVLLALWPIALLYPAAVSFGLGQVLERLENAITQLLMDTPFIHWMPVHQFGLVPLALGVEMLCVMLGALVPCLLAYGVARSRGRRVLLLPLVLGAGIAASTLSAALTWGPSHAWAWLTPPAQAGIAAALVAGLFLLLAPRRLCAALILIALTLHLSLLNQAPESAYFTQTLAIWEQGDFIRFYGLVQWLGWIWPFMTLGYALTVLVRSR
ncbi:MAG: VanZ family protein [Burkholderiaceae bacterium]|jgi:VanZ family protein|nr:VanZ family protein [Burkholderiaceae bacterium]